MSAVTAPTWTDVINKFMDAVKAVLFSIADFLVQNAGAIAAAIIGIGVAYGVYRMARRALPLLGRFGL